MVTKLDLYLIVTFQLQPSSEEASKTMIESIANIRRTNSETRKGNGIHAAGVFKAYPIIFIYEGYCATKTDVSTSGDSSLSSLQRFDLKLAQRSNVLKRIASQEEYDPSDDDETFIQTHRQASTLGPNSSRNSSFRSRIGSKMSVITTCSSDDSEADEHGQITSLGSLKKIISVSSGETSVGSLKAGRQFSYGSSASQGTIDDDLEEEKSFDFDENDQIEHDQGESSSILFGGDEPDLSDI